MTSPSNADQYVGRTAVDLEGTKIGKIGQVYLDDRTGDPMWVTVSTGLFGSRQSFAPSPRSGRSAPRSAVTPTPPASSSRAP